MAVSRGHPAVAVGVAVGLLLVCAVAVSSCWFSECEFEGDAAAVAVSLASCCWPEQLRLQRGLSSCSRSCCQSEGVAVRLLSAWPAAVSVAVTASHHKCTHKAHFRIRCCLFVCLWLTQWGLGRSLKCSNPPSCLPGIRCTPRPAACQRPQLSTPLPALPVPLVVCPACCRPSSGTLHPWRVLTPQRSPTLPTTCQGQR